MQYMKPLAVGTPQGGIQNTESVSNNITNTHFENASRGIRDLMS